MRLAVKKAKFLCFILSLFVVSGCVPVILGVGVVTGYALSNDSAMGNINVGYHDLWVACKDILDSERADIIDAKESSGVIKAKISDVNFTLKIDSLSDDVQRLKISARKYLVPKPYVAQDIFAKIAKSLE